MAEPDHHNSVFFIQDGLVDGPARAQVGEEVAHCFLLASRRRRAVLNSVRNAGSYCGALVGRSLSLHVRRGQ